MTRIAVCGGVYSNPYALRAFLADARARGADELYCLGDLGGYGAEPDAIWPLLVDNGVTVVAGNYDVAIGRGDTDCGCGYSDPRDNEFAQLMYDFTLAHTSADYAQWMTTLPTERRFERDGVDVHLVHGSTLALNDFWWESLPEDQQRLRVQASGADLILCTHSGLPWQKRVDDTLVVNVGVLGRPANDGRREVWYAIVDLVDGRATAELVPLDYDWQAQAASMRAGGLPDAFVETVESGWWTTCLEIVPPYERSKGRYQLYRSALPSGFEAEAVSWADAPEVVDDGLPVVPLFGSPMFPPRLWLYTNFHCNLACSYCSVASSPQARKRSLGLTRVKALVDEAVMEGFTEIYLTGGEPFLEPDIVEMVMYATERLDVVLLTNGMLYQGWRLEQLKRLAGRERLVLQTSIDAASPEGHDVNRGRGSWQKAMDGLRLAVDMGLPVRVGMTETPENTGEVEPLRALLATMGIVGKDFAVRPLVQRGFSTTGAEIGEDNTVPELAYTADGVHWHPAGADVETSPDMLLAAHPSADTPVPLAEGKRLAVERFLTLRRADGSLPLVYNCAV
ncbi:MAG: radical SAM protein [Actinobacteria bacterium]|nr:radical SAM protein [Actinomycetota bacterium]MBW3648347.1 radical SAM protein [Actinomycetota bacterium]